jgi:small basic protein
LDGKFRQAWFNPVFSSILSSPAERIALAGFGVLQVGLHMAGLPGWVCPFKAVFGIPCPGCGLTAAMDQLLHGDVRAALQTHFFAPVFLVAFLVIFAATLLPGFLRDKMVAGIDRFERRTGMTAWVLSILILYWGIRLFGLV